MFCNKKLSSEIFRNNPGACIRISATLFLVLLLWLGSATMSWKELSSVVVVAKRPVHRCSSSLFHFSPLYCDAIVGLRKKLYKPLPTSKKSWTACSSERAWTTTRCNWWFRQCTYVGIPYFCDWKTGMLQNNETYQQNVADVLLWVHSYFRFL